MTPQELAILFLHQIHAWREGVPRERSEPNAIYVWEDLISNDPEQAWPVFEELLRRTSHDEVLEPIWYRLEDDGDVYHRFQELMQTIDVEPN